MDTGRLSVLVIDWDAHHGNGTQAMFVDDAKVFYVSMHEWPLYPGTGRIDEIGTGPGTGTTLNFPFPAGTTGDAYLDAIDNVVEPIAEQFRPDWVLISAGFDAHRDDPLTGLGLSAGDYADLTARVISLAPARRVIARSSRAATTSKRSYVRRHDRVRPGRRERAPGPRLRPPEDPAGQSSEPSGTCERARHGIVPNWRVS